MEFIYDDARSLGGRQSYDVSCDNGKHYEVKCYTNDKTPIRLGTEGTVSRSKGYMSFITLMIAINKMTSMSEADLAILRSMINNVEDKFNDNNNFKEYMTNLFTTKSGDNYYFKLMKGEFCPSDIDKMSSIIDTIKSICDEIYNNKFEFAKLIKENKMYIAKLDEDGKPIINQNDDSVSIECVTTDVNEEEKIKKYIIDIRDTLNGCYNQYGIKYESENAGKEYIDKFISLSEEEINKEFDQYHPMMLINSNFTSPIMFGVFRKFLIYSISQSGFSVLPNNENNSNRVKKSRNGDSGSGSGSGSEKIVKKMVKNKNKK